MLHMSKSQKEKSNGRGDEEDKYRVARIITRFGISIILLFSTIVTITYCYNVIFDRYLVYKDTLSCTIDLLNRDRRQYWLRNGTLLGAERMGKLILWDSRLSIGLLSNSDIFITMEDIHKTCFPQSFSYDSNTPRKWEMCSSNICAHFDEAIIVNETVRMGYGTSPLKELFPLKECFLMDIKTYCPRNSEYYLERSYGAGWFSTPFTDLFSKNATAL